MEHRSGLTRSHLRDYFCRPPGTEERVGIEIECGLVDPESGVSRPYGGPMGTRQVLEALLADFGAEPIEDGPFLVGVRLQDGSRFTLEMGGALEYSSTPDVSLTDLVSRARRDVERAAGVAQELGIAVLSGGMLPFTSRRKIPWIPKPRVQIMRDFFRAHGADGRLSDDAMGLTLSTQTSLDFTSYADLFEKLRLHTLVTPALAALSVNSPIEDGRNSGAQSRRLQFWQRVEPGRCGMLPFALDQFATIDDLIDWVLDLPMIYRLANGVHSAAPANRTFGDLIQNGFGDGTAPGWDDWISHLSQIWTDVRVRQTLELRASDGSAWPAFAATPAVWVGLTYHRPSRLSAIALLDGLTPHQLRQALVDVATKGLAAMIGPHSAGDIAKELLRLAREGLAARVQKGQERSEILAYLDPLERVSSTGISSADRCIERWTTEFREMPAKFVQAFRI